LNRGIGTVNIACSERKSQGSQGREGVESTSYKHEKGRERTESYCLASRGGEEKRLPGGDVNNGFSGDWTGFIALYVEMSGQKTGGS